MVTPTYKLVTINNNVFLYMDLHWLLIFYSRLSLRYNSTIYYRHYIPLSFLQNSMNNKLFMQMLFSIEVI